MNSEKVKYINLQMIGIIGFVLALFLSYLINYDKRSSLLNTKRLFDDKTAYNMIKVQTTLIFIVSLLFLYINYNQYKIALKTGSKDTYNNYLSIGVSLFAIMGALLSMYIVYNSGNNQITIAETEI